MAVPLPIKLPLSDMTDLAPFDDITDKIHFVLAKAIAGKKKKRFHIKLTAVIYCTNS